MMSELPIGWKWTTIEKIAAEEPYSLVGNTFGSRLKASEYTDEGVPIIRGNNLSGPGMFNPEGTTFITEEKADNLLSQNAIAGDVIFTQQGSVGQVGIIPENSGFDRWVVSQSQMKLRPNRNITSSLWVYYYFRLPHVIEKLQSRAIVTGVPHINLGILREFPIVLPPIDEQNAILEILGSLDDKIEANRRMNDTLEATARAIFKSWFVDFDPVHAKANGDDPIGMDAETAALFPDSFEDSELGLLPSGWRVGTLDETINLIGGGTPKTSIPEYWDGDIYWFSVKDVPSDTDVFVIETEKQITQAGIENSSARLLPELTTIISARGTVGKLALTGVEMAMNQSCYGIRGVEGFPEYFTYFHLKTRISELQQHTHGTVFDTITRNTFSNLQTIIPNSEVAVAYDNFVEPLLEQIRNNVFESRTLAETRDALLPKLVSGELRVGDGV